MFDAKQFDTDPEFDTDGLAREDELGDDDARPSDSAGQGPVGQGEHEIREGECVSSIAAAAGLTEEKLWNDPANAEMKAARRERNILLQGDRLHVPELARKDEAGATEMRHRFQLKTGPVMLRLRMLDEDQPRAREVYHLKIDGQIIQGKTDAAGMIEQEIPPQARKAVLRMGDINSGEDYVLQLGTLDPLDQLSGVQSRLRNLGFAPGAIDGVLSLQTEAALAAFQRKHKLEATSKPDAITRQKLKEQYGC
jgi:N-acetylmuramoyl-L-alanine amidase